MQRAVVFTVMLGIVVSATYGVTRMIDEMGAEAARETRTNVRDLRAPPQTPERFRTVTHTVSGDERVVVVDVPDPAGFYDRCIVYVNDRSGSSSMQCDFGGSLGDR